MSRVRARVRGTRFRAWWSRACATLADSHKHKKWQDYAAGTAAAMKVLVKRFVQTDKPLAGRLERLGAGGVGHGPVQGGHQTILHEPISGHNAISGMDISDGTTSLSFQDGPLQ